MTQIPYKVVDVFTNKRFTGNPLAVFPDAEDIREEDMQRIASELNLSETVFVLPSDSAVRRLRIFTPRQELPLAGHPVVGTWKVLSDLGVVEPSGDKERITIEHELGVGVLPVTIEFHDGVCVAVEMQQAEFDRKATLDSEDAVRLANALGLTASDIGNARISTCDVVSTGIYSLAVPVNSLDKLGMISPDPVALSSIYTAYGAVGVYAYCFDTHEAESHVAARFFAPADGIPEDPATGSAAGALTGNLASRDATDLKDYVIEQGDFMGRPSRINVRVGSGGEIFVGGSSVSVFEGHLDY